MRCVMKFIKGFDLVKVNKVVLQIVLIIISQKIRNDSYNSLCIETMLTFHNVIYTH